MTSSSPDDHPQDAPHGAASAGASHDASTTEHSPASDSGAGGAGGTTESDGASEQLAAARQEAAQLEDRLRRAVADTENLRKRHLRERDRERLADRMRAAEVWLPVLDNLELALQHAGQEDDPFIEGVRAVYHQGVEAMARLGFPRFDAQGATFDPVLHEAVSSFPDAAQAGQVLAVTRPGYGTAEALLRPAQVVVAVGS